MNVKTQELSLILPAKNAIQGARCYDDSGYDGQVFLLNSLRGRCLWTTTESMASPGRLEIFRAAKAE